MRRFHVTSSGALRSTEERTLASELSRSEARKILAFKLRGSAVRESARSAMGEKRDEGLAMQ